jgi:hypothetical protein
VLAAGNLRSVALPFENYGTLLQTETGAAGTYGMLHADLVPCTMESTATASNTKTTHEKGSWQAA